MKKEEKIKVSKEDKKEKLKIVGVKKDYDFKTLPINETEYKTLLTKKFLNRKVWQQPNPDNIYSFIPGTVEQIFVKPGDEVLSGEPMLILEAMKMKNKLLCPRDAIIKAICVDSGQVVAKGILMIELEALEIIEVED